MRRTTSSFFTYGVDHWLIRLCRDAGEARVERHDCSKNFRNIKNSPADDKSHSIYARLIRARHAQPQHTAEHEKHDCQRAQRGFDGDCS